MHLFTLSFRNHDLDPFLLKYIYIFFGCCCCRCCFVCLFVCFFFNKFCLQTFQIFIHIWWVLSWCDTPDCCGNIRSSLLDNISIIFSSKGQWCSRDHLNWDKNTTETKEYRGKTKAKTDHIMSKTKPGSSLSWDQDQKKNIVDSTGHHHLSYKKKASYYSISDVTQLMKRRDTEASTTVAAFP